MARNECEDRHIRADEERDGLRLQDPIPGLCSGIHGRTGKIPAETSHIAKVSNKDKQPKERNYITCLGQQLPARLGCCMNSTIGATPHKEMGPRGHLDSEDTPKL